MVSEKDTLPSYVELSGSKPSFFSSDCKKGKRCNGQSNEKGTNNQKLLLRPKPAAKCSYSIQNWDEEKKAGHKQTKASMLQCDKCLRCDDHATEAEREAAAKQRARQFRLASMLLVLSLAFFLVMVLCFAFLPQLKDKRAEAKERLNEDLRQATKFLSRFVRNNVVGNAKDGRSATD